MIKNLTTEEFKELVFDYVKSEEWAFKGKKPVVIDFYADWCQPCKMVAPILDELDNEYDNIDIYKVDTEAQGEIAAAFGIKNLPSLLFIPLEGQPQMVVGALPKETLKLAINDVLFGEKPDDEVLIGEKPDDDDNKETK